MCSPHRKLGRRIRCYKILKKSENIKTRNTGKIKIENKKKIAVNNEQCEFINIRISINKYKIVISRIVLHKQA